MSLPILTLQIVGFLDFWTIGLLIPLVPIQIEKLRGTRFFIGILGSLYSGFQLGSGPVIGSLSDLKGRKKVLAMTLLLCSGAYIVMGLTTSLYVMLFTRAFLGLFKQTQLLTKSLVPDYENNQQKLPAIYGKLAAISGIGMTTGPLVGGHIMEKYPDNGFSLISIAVGLSFILNSGLVSLLPEIKNQLKNEIENNSRETSFVVHYLLSTLKKSVIILYKIKWSRFWDIFMYEALAGFAMAVYYSMYVLYLKSQFHLDAKHIGYVISFQSAIASVISFYIGIVNRLYKSDEDYTQRNFHVFLFMTISVLGLIFSPNVFFFIFCLIPLSMGSAVVKLVTLEMLLKRCNLERRGSLIGALNSARCFSSVLGQAVAGYIAEYVGMQYVIYASLIATFLGAIMGYCTLTNSNIKIKSE